MNDACLWVNTGEMTRAEAVDLMVRHFVKRDDAERAYRFFSDDLARTNYAQYYYGRRIVNEAFKRFEDSEADRQRFFDLLYRTPQSTRTFVDRGGGGLGSPFDPFAYPPNETRGMRWSWRQSTLGTRSPASMPSRQRRRSSRCLCIDAEGYGSPHSRATSTRTIRSFGRCWRSRAACSLHTPAPPSRRTTPASGRHRLRRLLGSTRVRARLGRRRRSPRSPRGGPSKTSRRSRRASQPASRGRTRRKGVHFRLRLDVTCTAPCRRRRASSSSIGAIRSSGSCTRAEAMDAPLGPAVEGPIAKSPRPMSSGIPGCSRTAASQNCAASTLPIVYPWKAPPISRLNQWTSCSTPSRWLAPRRRRRRRSGPATRRAGRGPRAAPPAARARARSGR
jgi:hypothetical protein